jgi:hypothetical protein
MIEKLSSAVWNLNMMLMGRMPLMVAVRLILMKRMSPLMLLTVLSP